MKRFRVWGIRIQGFVVQCTGFRVQGSGFGILGFVFRVCVNGEWGSELLC